MKRLLAVLVALAFLSGISGAALAQAPADKKADDKKTSDKMGDKKMATKTASGTVKSAGADRVVVAGKDKGKEAEWTFAVDGKTKVRKAGKNAAAADLAPGDAVSVQYTERDGKATATAITVRAATAKKVESKPAEKK